MSCSSPSTNGGGIACRRLAIPGIVEAMWDNDFLWAAQNRKRILGEWQKRYDSKSLPK